jgi:poly-gamma-glutamate synthesis protein (capsule biosynthesis protein)
MGLGAGLGIGFERLTRPHTEDMRRNLQAVTEARRMADWVIFSIHNHEYGVSRDESAAHIQALAHAVIDAGADVVVGHGPHHDRGIEIYHDKPIIYSLGAFITQTHTTSRQPHDLMQMFGLNHESSVAELFELRGQASAQPGPGWWGVVPVLDFEARRLRRLTLHPIELGFGQPRSQSGRPMLANGTYAEQALERVRRLSTPFGTTVDIQKGLGVVSMD